ncbi:larval cuticle protein 4-like [Musca autumnalis]|uniref:larval cuticle protein 4-like n=1 Tax=Musca autumnalis TaxID=221902 RepID=UPI003CEAA130
MFKFLLIAVTALVAIVAADELVAQTYLNDVRADGFENNWQLEHSRQAAKGDANGNMIGFYEYDTPEGEHVRVHYTADENGYHPESEWLPTPPPIPAHVLRAMEYIRTHPPKP